MRPDVFGFYGTQWRQWPRAGVVQAANVEAVTPARPPAAEVPGPNEESPDLDSADANPPAPDAVGRPAESASPEPLDEGAAGRGPGPEKGEFPSEGEAVVVGATEPLEAGEMEEEPADSEGAPAEESAADAATAQGECEEPASSTAWRSFTAAERRRRESRP